MLDVHRLRSFHFFKGIHSRDHITLIAIESEESKPNECQLGVSLSDKQNLRQDAIESS